MKTVFYYIKIHIGTLILKKQGDLLSINIVHRYESTEIPDEAQPAASLFADNNPENATEAEVARIGAPHAARAVGQACRQNPLQVVVPCHRVVKKKRKERRICSRNGNKTVALGP